MPHIQKPKLVVILGPTASGKSALAVRLAKKFSGEIISADSRQIYKGLDIGTGKITKRDMRGITHYCLDLVSPKRNFSVAEFVKSANVAIRQITSRGKTAILVGGTGLYIDAVARGIIFPEVPPNPKLRKYLSRKSTTELFRMLKSRDPERATAIDHQNPRRLIRALEIIEATDKPIPSAQKKKPYRTIFIGIQRSTKEIHKRIRSAIRRRIKRGLIKETTKLLKLGISAKRLGELGLDYPFAILVLNGSMPRRALTKKLEEANWNYAKRQMTWFRKNPHIHWVKSQKEAERLVSRFIYN